MSRVGKMPIAVPKGVDVSITAEQILVAQAERFWCDSAKARADEHRHFICRRDQNGDAIPCVGQHEDDGIGQKRLRAQHTLGLRSAKLSARLPGREREKGLDNSRLRRGVVQAGGLRRPLPLLRGSGKRRGGWTYVDAAHDLTRARDSPAAALRRGTDRNEQQERDSASGGTSEWVSHERG